VFKKLLVACAFAIGVGLVASAPAAVPQDKKDKKPPPKKDDKPAPGIDKAKLVGVWEITDEGGGGAGGKGAIYEFTKDGKAKVSAPKKKGLEGTYTLDGDKLTWKVGLGDVKAESPPFKVTKVTDKELVLEGVDGKPITLTRK
jgi:uncharacterized protein (TIGR03066 family)